MVQPITDTPDRNEPLVDEARLPTEGMFIWMALITDLLEKGYTGTITTAALTGAGAQGSMTFEHGILVSQTQAT